MNDLTLWQLESTNLVILLQVFFLEPFFYRQERQEGANNTED
jgi:hypothetical protein